LCSFSHVPKSKIGDRHLAKRPATSQSPFSARCSPRNRDGDGVLAKSNGRRRWLMNQRHRRTPTENGSSMLTLSTAKACHPPPAGSTNPHHRSCRLRAEPATASAWTDSPRRSATRWIELG